MIQFLKKLVHFGTIWDVFENKVWRNKNKFKNAHFQFSHKFFHLDQAINECEDKRGLARAIIGIFCDCELITDDEGFDSKLNFRLPFYTLLEGLWKIEEYRNHIIDFSNESLQNMNNQPLFLRFISLLIDDSNKMMGNGLEVLQKIRVTEHKVEYSGLLDQAWQSITH